MSDDERELKRVLGPLSAVSVVVGAIIGVGIFFTPSRVAAVTGSGTRALMTWALGGAIALVGALSFAELGGMYPSSGGQYRILRDAYGGFTAFLYVFCNATAIQAGALAIIAIICAQNIGVAVAGAALGQGATAALAVALIAGLTAANAAGARWGAGIQNATVVAKLATLAAVTALAAASTPAAAPAAIAPGSASLMFAGLVPVLFSFGGWQQALWVGGEIEQPERNVPRAIIVGVCIVIAVYLLANWAYLRLLGHEGVATSTTLAADAVSRVWPAAGSRVVAGAVAASAFGVMNAQLLTGPRLVYGMARDGRFIAAFGRVHPQLGTPVAAIALLGAIGVALLLGAGADGVDKLLTGVVLIDAAFFALTGAAVIVLRKRRPDAARPVKVPGYPLVPALFVAGELAVMYGAFADPSVRAAAFIGVAWIAAAAVCYMLVGRRVPLA